MKGCLSVQVSLPGRPSTIDLSQFRFSDLLALILALFAMGLSVAFYLKATETSNTFYDNTYQFTREVSEILGRIEAGFGERLRHLDEGYAGLVDKVGSVPRIQPQDVKDQINDEQGKLEAALAERDDLLKEFASTAKIQEREKEKFLKEIRSRNGQIKSLVSELEFLRHKLQRAGASRSATLGDLIGPKESASRARSYAKHVVLDMLGGGAVLAGDESIVRKRFRSLADKLDPRFLRDLTELGLIDKNAELTPRGLQWLRDIAGEEFVEAPRPPAAPG